jgi:PAS domain S-box-containing protein
MRMEKNWSQTQVRRFQFVARVLALTLARRRTTQELVLSEERLQLATESADVGLWGTNVATGRVWVTAKAREVLGLADDRDLTVEGFFGLVHADDRAKVRECVLRSLETGAELFVEYRRPMVSAAPRWIVSRGRAHRNESGEIEYLTGVVADISRRKQTEAELERNLEEVKRLHEQLQRENLYLRSEVRSRHGATSMVGNSDVLLDAIRLAEQVASTDSTVLILGETGTGKELLAQYIHRISRRCDNAFITTNIAAIPGTLLESELFGREKGAYTGALTREIGRFEMANGGTLFLDEIGEMPLETQAKLLRVLQSGEFERLGSGKTVRVDVRVITATNRNLTELIKAGKFREDLFYRLNVFPVTLPPLRNRPEDIPLLIWAFVKELSEKMGKAIDHIRKKDVDALQSYAWPGNVRELRNIVERSMILADGPELRLSFPDGQAGKTGWASRKLADVQRQHIQDVLQVTQNRVYGSGGAAEILGIKPTTLYSLMARLGIQRKH